MSIGYNPRSDQGISMKALIPAQRQYLKGLAHSRQPVVMIGSHGLTPAVMKEIELALNAHELIKIKAASNEPDTRRAWLEEICAATGAAQVQQIGKVLVIYRTAAKAAIALPG
jgi:RNA-binding protein